MIKKGSKLIHYTPTKEKLIDNEPDKNGDKSYGVCLNFISRGEGNRDTVIFFEDGTKTPLELWADDCEIVNNK